MERKVFTLDNTPDTKPVGTVWRKTGYPYMVRTDGGGLSTKCLDASSLTEARSLAKSWAKRVAWAEIFRWCENGNMIKPVFMASYDWSDPVQ